MKSIVVFCHTCPHSVTWDRRKEKKVKHQVLVHTLSGTLSITRLTLKCILPSWLLDIKLITTKALYSVILKVLFDSIAFYLQQDPVSSSQRGAITQFRRSTIQISVTSQVGKRPFYCSIPDQFHTTIYGFTIGRANCFVSNHKYWL